VAVRFAWNENKNRSNRAKHGISFDTAADVFADPNAIMRADVDIDGEQRWQTIGRLQEGVVVVLVVHTTVGDGDELLIRIISARKATPRERRSYEEGDWSD
jgi:uncharacterized DUF497 family protein